MIKMYLATFGCKGLSVHNQAFKKVKNSDKLHAFSPKFPNRFSTRTGRDLILFWKQMTFKAGNFTGPLISYLAYWQIYVAD